MLRRCALLLAVLAVVAAALAAGASPASASCVPRDARLVLRDADAAIVGTVTSAGEGDYVVRVERSAKQALSGDVAVRDDAPNTSAALSARPGDRIGLALSGAPGAWRANGCDEVEAGPMLLAFDSAPPCEVGGTVRQRRAGGDGTVRSVILGCAGSTSGPLEVRAYARDGSGVCVAFDELAYPERAGRCGRLSLGRRAPAAVTSIGRSPCRISARGAARAPVREIRVLYRRQDGARRAFSAALIRVADPAVLRAIGVKRPFGVFVARLPCRSRDVRLVALDGRARRLGRVAVGKGLRLP